ncbi:hypothetical protein PTKIN_Ptkin05aG0076000 [Pterospermum kingtungense]
MSSRGQIYQKSESSWKLLIQKPYSLEAMCTTFIKAWQISNDLNIKEVRERLFLLPFGLWIEKAKVPTRQPWVFKKSLLVMRDMDEINNIEDVDMDWYPFWVQLHGLHIKYMTKKIGEVVGKKLEWWKRSLRN